tara:strand:- start:770 stop:1033 length:264 start_codon:yes stop_codon:yes gene_type:complete
MSIFSSFLDLFLSKEKRFYNSKAVDIMINKNNFDHSNLTLGNIFKVNENVKIKYFKDKIAKDNLTVVVINNKGKTLGYITRKELQLI